MNKVKIPRLPDGRIDAAKLELRAWELVNYGAYDCDPGEMAELVMAVVEFQKAMREVPHD